MARPIAREAAMQLVFEQIFGSHLVGFPILISAVLLVMYVPMELYRKHKRQLSVTT